MPSKVSISGGAFQDAAGNLVTGTLQLQLQQDAIVSGTGTVAPAIPVTITVTAGAAASTSVWGTDNLTPSGLVYVAQVFDASGARVWGPENWSLTGAGPIDISTLVPSSSAVSYPAAVLKAPTGDQAIASNNLLPASGNTTQSLGSTAAPWNATLRTQNTIVYADAFASLQAAHDALGSNGGTVVIPVGTFSGAVAISKPNVIFRGSGAGTIITAAASGTSSIITVTGANCRISDFRVNGQAVDGTTTQCGIELNANGCTVEKVYFTGADASHALNKFVQIDNGVTDCTVKNCRGDQIFGTASGVGYGVLLINCSHNKILDNSFVFSATQGRHHCYVSQGSTRNLVRGNYFEGGTAEMIPLYAFDNQSSCQGNSVVGNVLYNSASATGGMIAVLNNAINNLVEGNTLSTSSNHGILVYNASGVTAQPTNNTVAGNYVVAAGLNGIAVIGGVSNTISGNTVLNSSQASSGNYAGIEVAPDGSVASTGNKVLNNSSSGSSQKYALAIEGTPAPGTTVVMGNTLAAGGTGTLLNSGSGTIFGLNNVNGTSTANGSVTLTTPVLGAATGTSLALGGDSAFSASPRMFWGSLLPKTDAVGTFTQITPDKAITITRVMITAGGSGVGQTTAAVIRVGDGTNNVDTTLANSTSNFDSGAVAVNIAAGVALVVRVNTASSGGTAPTNVSVTVQYRMQ